MSIETQCPGCSRTLRVDDEHAGQQARCPVCGTIYSVPGERSSEEPAAPGASPLGNAAEPAESWRLRTPEGQLYGPVARAELDSWVAEGRVTEDCELLREGQSVWRPAVEVYPVLETPTSTNPYVATSETRYRYTAPHRGGLILVLGILGWVVGCPIFGVAAWVMGNADLEEMRSGRMDPSGRGLTQAGTILGMIQGMLLMLVLVVGLFALLARFAVRM